MDCTAVRLILCLWCGVFTLPVSADTVYRTVKIGERFEVSCRGLVNKRTCNITLKHTNAAGVARTFPLDSDFTLVRYSLQKLEYAVGDRELILTIDPVDLIDAGEFHCRAHACDGTYDFSSSETLVVDLPCARAKPASCFATRPIERVNAGRKQWFSMPCRIRSQFSPECLTDVVWLKECRQPCTPERAPSHRSADAEFYTETLTFESTQLANTGNYTCRASICNSWVVSASMYLDIY